MYLGLGLSAKSEYLVAKQSPINTDWIDTSTLMTSTLRRNPKFGPNKRVAITLIVRAPPRARRREEEAFARTNSFASRGTRYMFRKLLPSIPGLDAETKTAEKPTNHATSHDMSAPPSLEENVTF